MISVSISAARDAAKAVFPEAVGPRTVINSYSGRILILSFHDKCRKIFFIFAE
jgi:hypothetical protein